MNVEYCDLCKKPMCTYTDSDGRYWEGISFQSKNYRRRIGSLSICGRCRAEIAKKRSESDG